MSLRRRAVALAFTTLISGVFGAGLATPASAAVTTPPCDQVSQICTSYDAWRRLVATFDTAEYAACVANAPAAACTLVATVNGVVYTWVFFPYSACATVNGTTYCVGPL
jgi:hypothetical protein